ncbi:MAG: CapA family protein [Flexilinea sp.]|nr:CapA family protein [Flexilinea sp.]
MKHGFSRLFHLLSGAAAVLLWLVCFGNCLAGGQMVYALTAPYPTVTDGISLSVLRNFWRGRKSAEISELILTEETRAAFAEQWGEPHRRASVSVMSADELLPYAWDGTGRRALIPFEQLDPRWKVIAVDGASPYTQGFDPEHYALSLPVPEGGTSNYDPEKLTTLTMTGTTAMARNFSFHAETDGLLTTVENIAAMLSASDITHISNEVSFTPDCPPAVPLRREARFCSSPDYIAILEAVGADVIELTGNHNLDWGYDPFIYSMSLYDEAGMKTYGGGLTPEEADAPLLIEHHGNRIVFIGCNAIGPENVWVTDEHPGAARCDLEKMKTQIRELKENGWLPVVTFQHLEWTWYDVPALESHDFFEIAREAAPVIISGSQAHIPQGMTFVGDTFIHFGLGNLLFDQMSDVERTSFFDRHFFYDGRYLGNHPETIILENYSQPRFLEPEERAAFLKLIFDTCSWKEVFEER